MMDTVLGGTMGVLKHDVTMVTDMIDKYKGRTLPESNLPRNISSDGNVKNGTLSSLDLQHIARTPQPDNTYCIGANSLDIFSLS